jgi:hypothetical protein
MAQRRTTLPRPAGVARVRRVRTTAVICCIAIAVLGAGCGGGNASPPTTNASTSKTTRDPTAALNRAVRQALRTNYQLSSYVLWHNAVPSSAQKSTRGPALAALRNSAAQRRKSGIRIKPVSGRLTIISVSLDPSFTKATATTLASGRVRPYEGGKAEPRTIALHERARIQLRRLGRSQTFVVWQVTTLR